MTRYEIVPWSVAERGLTGGMRHELSKLYPVPRVERAGVWCMLAVQDWSTHHEPLIVGVTRFHLSDHWLSDCGTFVHRHFRGRGIAFRMWCHAIEQLAISEVVAYPVTRQGAVLIGKVAQAYADRVAFTLTPT